MKKKNIIFAIIILAIILIFIIGVIIKTNNDQKVANQAIIQNNNQANQAAITENASNNAAEQASVATPAVVSPIVKEAQVVVPGASLVAKDETVITPEGKPTENNVIVGSASAPKVTGPISSPSSLPSNVIKLGISAAGFSPKEFTVKAGAATTISLTSTDNSTHILIFADPSLSAVAIGVIAKETRAMTFNAPTKAGNYAFICRVPGHTSETGTMIVK